MILTKRRRPAPDSSPPLAKGAARRRANLGRNSSRRCFADADGPFPSATSFLRQDGQILRGRKLLEPTAHVSERRRPSNLVGLDRAALIFRPERRLPAGCMRRRPARGARPPSDLLRASTAGTGPSPGRLSSPGSLFGADRGTRKAFLDSHLRAKIANPGRLPYTDIAC